MNKDQVKGRVGAATGKVKEDVGKATDQRDLKIEGKLEKTGGKARSTFGDVKEEVKKGKVLRMTTTYHGPPIPSSIRIETRYPADPRRMVSLRITVIDDGGNEFEMSPRDLSDSESITLLHKDVCKDEV